MCRRVTKGAWTISICVPDRTDDETASSQKTLQLRMFTCYSGTVYNQIFNTCHFIPWTKTNIIMFFKKRVLIISVSNETELTSFWNRLRLFFLRAILSSGIVQTCNNMFPDTYSLGLLSKKFVGQSILSFLISSN